MSKLTWTKVGSTWRADSYRIELERPGKWALRDESIETGSRHSICMDGSIEDPDDSPVITDRSLRRLKARVEKLEAKKAESKLRSKYLLVVATGVLLFFVALTSPGAVAVGTAFGLLAVILYLLVKLTELGLGRRWDTIYEKYQ